MLVATHVTVVRLIIVIFQLLYFKDRDAEEMPDIEQSEASDDDDEDGNNPIAAIKLQNKC